MNDFSLMQKLQILMKILSSSSLFLLLLLILIATLIFYVISVKKNWKLSKWYFLILWIISFLILMICYNEIVLKLFDMVFDYAFKILYFPDLPIYIIVLIVSNIILLLSIFNKKINKSYKILNVVSATILDMMMFLVIDVVSKNNVDIYNNIEIYTNSNLLVLLELSIAVFISWILLNLFITGYYKLKKYDKGEYPKMPEIVFEELN